MGLDWRPACDGYISRLNSYVVSEGYKLTHNNSIELYFILKHAALHASGSFNHGLGLEDGRALSGWYPGSGHESAQLSAGVPEFAPGTALSFKPLQHTGRFCGCVAK